LNKGDAVMLVATQGSMNSQPMAITLLSGVEPFSARLLPAPRSDNLSPWNLGGPPGAGGEGSAQ